MPDVNVDQIMKQIKKGIRRKPEQESERFVSKYHSSILEQIKGKKEVVLFGAGRYGKTIFGELRKDNVGSVMCFCDNNERCIGMKIDKKKVLSPKEAFEKYPNAVFIITVINYPVEITAQLIEMGVKTENIIFYNYARSGL